MSTTLDDKISDKLIEITQIKKEKNSDDIDNIIMNMGNYKMNSNMMDTPLDVLK